jgi:hypothetical protein
MTILDPGSAYPRNFAGYGATPPDARWPNGARVALSFVLNYEEGGENNILHGDAASEAFLSEIVGAAAWPGMRHMNMESIYEYGSRAGFWRLHRMFTDRNMPVTVLYGTFTPLMVTSCSAMICWSGLKGILLLPALGSTAAAACTAGTADAAIGAA